MNFETIIFSLDEGIAKLTFNRPERLNSFTVRMHEEVAAAIGQAEAQKARVLLLTGAGRAFSTGQDLTDAPDDPGAPLETHYNPLMRRLAALPFPVVCAVNGVAAGAGANLALSGDIVIAAKSARFIQSFVHLGLVPDSGGTWLLPRLVGQARAMGLMLTGEAVDAERALAWGMIWKMVDDAALIDEAGALAAKLAAAPTRAVAAIRGALRTGWDNSLDAQLQLERSLQGAMGSTQDFREGVTAFREKRPPKFQGN